MNWQGAEMGKLRIVAMVVAGLIGFALFWLFEERSRHNPEPNHLALVTVSELKTAETKLVKSALELHAGIDRTYDQINEVAKEVDLLMIRFEGQLANYAGREREEILGLFEGFKESLSERAEAIERFKARNAILLNSQTYLHRLLSEALRTASVEEDAALIMADIGTLATSLEFGRSQLNRTRGKQIEDQIESLKKITEGLSPRLQTGVRQIEMHAKLLTRTSAPTYALLNKIIRSDAVPTLNRIGEKLETDELFLTERNAFITELLFAMACVLLLAVGYAIYSLSRVAVKLKENNYTLEARVEERTKQVEDEARRHRAVVDTVADGIVTIDERGVIETFNPAAAVLFGYGGDEVVGKNISCLMTEEDRLGHDGYIRNFLEGGKAKLIGTGREVEGKRKDGTTFPVDLSVTEMLANGQRMFTGILRDVTERKEAQEQIREREEALNGRVLELEDTRQRLEENGEELSRLADDLRTARDEAEGANRAKSDFLASMSHEIRTPMNGILGMTNALLAADLTDGQRQNAFIIKDSGEALLRLLNDILDLSKIEAGRIELEATDFSLDRLLVASNALWESRANSKGLDFAIHNNVDGLDVLRSDSGRIRQIIYNLIGNALKFTEQGRIDLYVDQMPRDDDKIEIRISVADTGIGISPEAVSKLFERFTQADSSTTRKYGGTGLGLSISKQIAELLDGQIGVESEEGRGSTFWVTFVVDEGDPTNVVEEFTGEQAVEAVNETGRALRILVAEDNEVNQMVIRSLLSPLECQLDIVGNGLEAVSAVIRSTYDVILMDVQMPEMDGPTATGEIRKLSGEVSNVPIIALTANAMKGDREKYLAAGMNDYVSKPIDQQILFSAIARCTNLSVPKADEILATGAPADEPIQLEQNAVDKLDDLLADMEGLFEDKAS